MKTRLLWMLGSAVVGAWLVLFSPSAMAQKPTATAGPNLGQQGEFNGEHVDTGAAALDSGPEMGAEATEGLENEALQAETLKTKASSPAIRGLSVKKPSSVTATGKLQPLKSTQDLNIEQVLDLQEIMGPDMAEMR